MMNIDRCCATADDHLLSLLALEYQQLKEEQRQRIGTRDNLVYATLAALAVVVGVSFQGDRPTALLGLAPVCVVLGWTYLANDHKVSAIRRYIHNVLTPQLARTIGTEREILGWEHHHRLDRGYFSRKLGQLGTNLLVFFVPGAAALLAYARMSPPTGIASGVAVGEGAALALLGLQLIIYADLRATPRRERKARAT